MLAKVRVHLEHFKNYLEKHKILIITLIGLFLFSFSLAAFATPPSSPYAPTDQILDPTCAPTDMDCYVSILPDQTGHSGEFLSTDGSSVVWSTVAGSGTIFTDGTLTGDGSSANPLSVVSDPPVLAVSAATTGPLSHTPTYNNNGSGIGATLSASTNGSISPLDGVALTSGNEILVKDQVTDLQNGIYDVTTLGDGSHPYVLTRATDSDESDELDSQIVSIALGTVNRGKLFAQTTNEPVVGTDPIDYVQTRGVSVSQKASGTQILGQIPYWTGVAKQLSKGTPDLTYNPTTRQVSIFSLLEGSAGQFTVDSSGNLTRINNVPYSWPTVQGATSTVLTNDGSGGLMWTTVSEGGTTTAPGGDDTDIQFNSAGSFDGSDNLTWDNPDARLGIGTSSPSYALDVILPTTGDYTATQIDHVSGLDDATFRGDYSGSDNNTYTVTIDGDEGTQSNFCLETGGKRKGGGYNFACPQIFSRSGSESPSFGVGLNDATYSGTFTGTAPAYFKVTLDSTGTPDLFSWVESDAAADEIASDSDVSITGSAQALNDGISITFGATTGHTMSDSWGYHIDDPNEDTFLWSDTDGDVGGNDVPIDADAQALSNGISITFGATTGHTINDSWSDEVLNNTVPGMEIADDEGDQYLVIDPSKDTYSIGDSYGRNKGTNLTINDAEELFTFSTPNLSVGGVQYAFPASQGGTNTVLTNDGSGNLSWTAVSSGGGGTTTMPGGSDGDVQFDSSGTFAGSDNLFWNNPSVLLGIGTNAPEANLAITGPDAESISYTPGTDKIPLSFGETYIGVPGVTHAEYDIITDSNGIPEQAFQDNSFNTPPSITPSDDSGSLDDATFGGSYTGSASIPIYFMLSIDSEGTPDTFAWTEYDASLAVVNSGSNVSIDGTAQTLADGITVQFDDTTGHTPGGDWWAYVIPTPGADSFEWDYFENSSSTASASQYFVPITGSSQSLNHGETVTFDSTTGNRLENPAGSESMDITEGPPHLILAQDSHNDPYFDVDPSNGLYALGDIKSANDGTYFSINDASQTINSFSGDSEVAVDPNSVSLIRNQPDCSRFCTGGNEPPIELRFFENTRVGTNYVGFRAPSSLSTSTMWILPDGDGTSGQVLSTDGTGTLSWINAGVPGGSNTDIQFNSRGTFGGSSDFTWDDTAKTFLVSDAGAQTFLIDPVNDNYELGINAGLGTGGGLVGLSNFIGDSAGDNATGAFFVNFIGLDAGFGATNGSDENFIGDGAGFEATNANTATFIGASAGSQAINATDSNFIGTSTGVETNSIAVSNFIGDAAGLEASMVTYSNFIGTQAGALVVGTTESNFIGHDAGEGASTSTDSNFIGTQAGLDATSISQSNFIGKLAGSGASNAYWSDFLGYQAGENATSSFRSNFIGLDAGDQSFSATSSNFIGDNAGALASSSTNSNFIGTSAGNQAPSTIYSNFIGYQAGNFAGGVSYSNFLGYQAGSHSGSTSSLSNDNYSNFIGYQAGDYDNGTPNAAHSIFIGYKAGYDDSVNNTVSGSSILIGDNTGTGGHSNSIALGTGAVDSTSNQLVIGSTSTPINSTFIVGSGSTQCTITTGTGISCSSDQRLKQNIADLSTSTLDTLVKVRTVTYNFINGPTTNQEVGFIAQDLLQYFPDLVSTDPNGYYAVNYAEITPILTEAIRELDLKVEPLTSLDTTVDGSLGSLISEFLQSTLINIKDLVVNTFSIGSANNPTGFTIYDTVTHNPYCVTITNGAFVNTPGQCADTDATSTNQTSDSSTTNTSGDTSGNTGDDSSSTSSDNSSSTSDSTGTDNSSSTDASSTDGTSTIDSSSTISGDSSSSVGDSSSSVGDSSTTSATDSSTTDAGDTSGTNITAGDSSTTISTGDSSSVAADPSSTTPPPPPVQNDSTDSSSSSN